ncbi:MAG: DUF5668 domain-containing protein [Candidatus Aminicenantes bacterium]|nr:DUF5668 domain-containing protein [Candidatus Aminicenantes bacterium]
MADTKQVKNEKNPVGAAVLSALCPGIGFFYLGNKIKGIAYIFIMIFLVLLVTEGHGKDVVVFSLLLAGFYIFQVFDSFDEARKMNESTAAEDKKSMGISLAWAITLVAVGIVCQLAELDIITYRNVAKLWPLVLIGFGAKYIYNYNRSKTGDQHE